MQENDHKTYLGIFRHSFVDKCLQRLSAASQIDASTRDALALLGKFVKPFLTSAGDDDVRLRGQLVNREREGTADACGGPDDEDTFRGSNTSGNGHGSRTSSLEGQKREETGYVSEKRAMVLYLPVETRRRRALVVFLPSRAAIGSRHTSIAVLAGSATQLRVQGLDDVTDHMHNCARADACSCQYCTLTNSI